VVMSGLPAQSQLFNGTVCADRPSLREFAGEYDAGHRARKVTSPPGVDAGGSTEYRAAEHYGDHPVIEHAAPLILHKMDRRTLKVSKVKDIVVAIHSGVVTSYSGNGEFNWQVRTAPKWTIDDGSEHGSDYIGTVATVYAFDADANRASDLGHQNSVFSNIFISGEKEVQLISRDGDELAHAEVPKPPIAAPVFGDFDNDGVTDVVIVTQGAILGYHVHVVQASRLVLMALVGLASLALVVFVSNLQRVPSPGAGGSGGASSVSAAVLGRQTSSAARTMSGNRTVPRSKVGGLDSYFQVIRSTDDHHLD
jgi:hypothetical protein